jgi:cytochrome c oxidase cbb3-type subunit III
MKKWLVVLITWVATASLGLAQATEAKSPTSIWDDPLHIFYVLVAFIFVIALLVLIVALYMLQLLNYLAREAAKERAAKLGIVYKPAPSMWAKIWQQSNDFVPMEKEAEILLDHSYDGIRELDNHLPPWWKGLFVGTIAFSVVYLVIFHVLDTLPLQQQEYDTEVAYAQEQAQKLKAASPTAAIDETNVEAATDALALADGKQIFLNTCASCHRKDGGGDIGPNLTDEYWLHGGSIKEIFKVVRHGVQGTNMIAWQGVISPDKMKSVASYILTLKGANPPSPKKPQGELFKPEKKEVPIK